MITDEHLFWEACASCSTESCLACSCDSLVPLQAVKNDGQTALHEAAEAGQKEAVEYLLSVGANTQAQDEVSAIPVPPYRDSLMRAGCIALSEPLGDATLAVRCLPRLERKRSAVVVLWSAYQATLLDLKVCIKLPLTGSPIRIWKVA